MPQRPDAAELHRACFATRLPLSECHAVAAGEVAAEIGDILRVKRKIRSDKDVFG